MKTYRERLIAARTAAGLTQSALAKIVGIRQQTIQYLETEEKNAKGSSHTGAIARACCVSPHWLANNIGEMQLSDGPRPVEYTEYESQIMQLARAVKPKDREYALALLLYVVNLDLPLPNEHLVIRVNKKT